MCFRRAAGNKPASTIGCTIAVLGSRTPLSVDTRARTGRRPLGDPKWLRCRLVAAMNPWACANRKPSSLAPAPAKFASVRRPRRMPDGDRAGSRLVGESGCWSWGETGSFFDYGFGFLEGLKEGGMARPGASLWAGRRANAGRDHRHRRHHLDLRLELLDRANHRSRRTCVLRRFCAGQVVLAGLAGEEPTGGLGCQNCDRPPPNGLVPRRNRIFGT